MNIEEATKILTTLADGINPITGEILPTEDSCNQVEVVRALNMVLRVLTTPREKTSKSTAENAGKPWSREDDEMLREMFHKNYSRKDICNYFGRSIGSITARLVRLGEIENRDDFR